VQSTTKQIPDESFAPQSSWCFGTPPQIQRECERSFKAA
jgi:hypothetical protein